MYAIKVSSITSSLRLALNFLALLGLAMMTNTPLAWIGVIAIIMLLALVMTGTQAEDIYTFISLIPFHHLVSFEDRNIIFILLLFAIAKVIFFRLTIARQVPLTILPAMGLLSLSFMNDFGAVQLGELLYVLCSLGYFLVVITLADLRAYNHSVASKYLMMSLTIALITMLLSPGAELSVLTGSMLRFGYELRVIGGAMGAPIYSLMGISILVGVISSKGTPFMQKVLMIVAIMGLVVIGLSTISRVFIIGAVALVIVAAAAALRRYTSIVYRIAIVSLFFGLLYIWQYTAIPMSLLQRYALRIQGSDFSTGRLDIFLSITEYLSENPVAIVVGRGILNYSQIGRAEGLAFQALAHNLFLDGLMAWGFLGLTFLAIVVFSFLRRCRARGRVTLISALPAIVLLSTYVSWGSFSFFNTYMYLIFVGLGTFSHRYGR